jgi:hypothetical protein
MHTYNQYRRKLLTVVESQGQTNHTMQGNSKIEESFYLHPGRQHSTITRDKKKKENQHRRWRARSKAVQHNVSDHKTVTRQQ